LLSLTVPHYNTTTPTWVKHELTDTSWWNLYLNNLGDGSAAFKDTPATANSTVLIRMNSDTDRDGYSDRTELALGTNPNDAASHPTPALTAATRSVRVGNVVTTTMAFLNSGNYDAYGVEAVMYAPDSTVTINDNTIGGSGRVKSASQVVLGSRVMPASTTNWRGTSKPYSTGSYSGNTDKIFTFTAANPGNIGQGTVNINWNDGAGNSGTVNFGAGYNAPLPVTIRDGLQIGFDTGTVNTGDSFTVEVRLPRDTFSYTINQEPYTKPVVVVSYNDPQGNHKFVTPVEVSDLGVNLAPYASQMLPGVGVDISTNAAFNASGNNTVYLVANSPHAQPIVNGHLFVEYVNDTGTVVAEDVFTQTLQSGPTVVPVTFHVSRFNPAYQAGHDYTLLAFFTDSQGNIIDSHARLFSTFGADPQPVLNTSPAAWNFGTVTQGAQPQQTISIVNTGIMPLNVVVNSSDPKLTLSGASGIISVPPAGTTPVVASLDTTTLNGAVSMSITIRSNDPAHQTVTVPVNGTVTTATGSAAAFDIPNRPLDKTVRVYGNVPQFTPVDFTHGIAPDTATIEPCKVYAADGTTLKGVGKYCADFATGTASYEMFGDGRDGDLTVVSGQTVTINTTRVNVTASGTLAYPANSNGFSVGDTVMFHQTQGTANAGRWELAQIAAINSPTTWTLTRPLIYTYDNSNGRAQAIKVSQYRNVTVQSGGTLTAPAWDGMTGGIVVFLVSGTASVEGIISMEGLPGSCSSSGDGITWPGAPGLGFRGGAGKNYNWQAWSGEGNVGPSVLQTAANGTGGGGGRWAEGGHAPGGGGGGGGHATRGTDGAQIENGTGGSGGEVAGTADLTVMLFGGGGGGHFKIQGYPVCGGGGGGGIVVVFAKTLGVTGSLSVRGGQGGGRTDGTGGGGGGAGGSILVKASNANLGTDKVLATGGTGGTGQGPGGNGSVGRIRVEYCNTISGSTNPPASTQKLTCYIAEKTDANTVRYTVPDVVTAPGQNYVMQFARRLAFSGAGNQLTYTRVVSQTYANATMDVLVTNVGAGGATNLRLEIGDSVVYSATQTITQPTTINIPNFASAVNQYLITQSPNSTIDVPMRVTIDRQADVLLTNLGLTPGAGVDLVVNPGDLVIGCPGGASCLATEGNTVPITVTVRNTGAQNAASAVVGYYAGNPQAGGRLLGNSYVATIPAGGTTNANFNWNTEGFTRTQTLYAFVDPPNAIAETLENNNIVSQTLYIKTKPDLRVASIALSSTDRVVGEPITATIVISNTGETDSGSHFVNVSTLGERGDSTSQEWLATTVPATTTRTLTTTLAPVLFGTHTITVTADVTNLIAESVESNNVMTRTVFIGLPAQAIDAGAASDLAYDAARGFGWLNGATYDFGGGTITKTVRYDGAGALQYRFDGLQPTRSYHLDATFYQEGESFTQKILFDGIDSGKTISLVNGQPSTTSILIPPAAYADGTVIVTIQRQPGGTASPLRRSPISNFQSPTSVGPAFVSQLTLTPIEYTYLDSGGASDVAYDAARGYGYLNGFASGLGGSDAVSTYRTVFTSTVYYRFNNLNPAKNYNVNLTMYDGVSSTRAQTITIDGAVAIGCANLPVNSIVRATCPVTPTLYSTDRTITIGVVCGNCTGPRVNEIALEEKTRDIIEPPAPPTPTPTFTPTATPTSTVQTTISAFAAQWSGNVVQVTWSTTREYKTDQFQLYRSTTLDPGAWTVVKTQASQSACASVTTPYSYAFTDTNVVTGQTYYYKLAWSGDTCGVALAGAYPTPAIARAPGLDLFLPLIQRDGGSSAPQLVPILTPTRTPTPNRTPTITRTPVK
jgi:hypothetical protein